MNYTYHWTADGTQIVLYQQNYSYWDAFQFIPDLRKGFRSNWKRLSSNHRMAKISQQERRKLRAELKDYICIHRRKKFLGAV